MKYVDLYCTKCQEVIKDVDAKEPGWENFKCPTCNHIMIQVLGGCNGPQHHTWSSWRSDTNATK